MVNYLINRVLMMLLLFSDMGVGQTLPPLNRISIKRHLGLTRAQDPYFEAYIAACEDNGPVQTDAAETIAAADAALAAWRAATSDQDTDIIKAGTAEFDPMLKIGLLHENYRNLVADMARALGLKGFLNPYNNGLGYLTGFAMQ